MYVGLPVGESTEERRCYLYKNNTEKQQKKIFGLILTDALSILFKYLKQWPTQVFAETQEKKILQKSFYLHSCAHHIF